MSHQTNASSQQLLILCTHIGYSKENLKIHTGVPSPLFRPSLTLPSPFPLPCLPLPLPLPHRSYIVSK